MVIGKLILSGPCTEYMTERVGDTGRVLCRDAGETGPLDRFGTTNDAVEVIAGCGNILGMCYLPRDDCVSPLECNTEQRATDRTIPDETLADTTNPDDE